MHTNHTTTIAALLISLLSMPSLAAEVEYAQENKELTSCGSDINLLPPPKEIKVGETSFVTGGICTGGVEQMKSLATKYPLEIVLVEKVEGKEIYIADVNVQIKGPEDALVLDVSTDGPFLLVNIPDGPYQITTEYNGEPQSKTVTVNSKKHARVVFVWPTNKTEATEAD